MNSRREWWQTNNYHVSQRLKTICSLNVNHNKSPTLQLNVVCQRSRDFFKNGRLTAFHHYPEVLCRHKTILTELNFHLLEDNIPERQWYPPPSALISWQEMTVTGATTAARTWPDAVPPLTPSPRPASLRAPQGTMQNPSQRSCCRWIKLSKAESTETRPMRNPRIPTSLWFLWRY